MLSNTVMIYTCMMLIDDLFFGFKSNDHDFNELWMVVL